MKPEKRWRVNRRQLIDEILPLDAVIFDLDGTLINSPEIYYRVVRAAFGKLGLAPVTREALYHAAQNGEFQWDEVLPLNDAEGREVLIAKTRAVIFEMYSQFFPGRLRMIDGVAKALRKIAAAGLKIGIVTSTPRKLMAAKEVPLKESGVEGLFESVVTSDDVRRVKPDPEPLLLCAERLGVPAEKTAYVGDTLSDIRAGIAGGMKTVAVLTGFATRKALEEERPALILESAAGLVYSPRKSRIGC